MSQALFMIVPYISKLVRFIVNISHICYQLPVNSYGIVRGKPPLISVRAEFHFPTPFDENVPSLPHPICRLYTQ